MGCDIHGALELNNGAWRKIHNIPDNRDYDMFGILAGVRNYVNANPIDDPRGIPDDLSEDVKEEIMRWDMDGHSYSWLTWKDIEDYDWNQTSLDGRISEVDKATDKELVKSSYTWLQDHPEEAEKQGIVLKHLNRTMKDLIKETWQKLFDEMKELAKQVGSESVRIIFWFDN